MWGMVDPFIYLFIYFFGTVNFDSMFMANNHFNTLARNKLLDPFILKL